MSTRTVLSLCLFLAGAIHTAGQGPREIASERGGDPALARTPLAAAGASSAPVGSRPQGVESVYSLSSANDDVELRLFGGQSLLGHSTGDVVIDRFILDSSQRYGVDPLLTLAQMGQESSYRRGAVSPKGATGLMQLMPATAKRLGVTNLYDPRQNIDAGVKYMRLLLDMFGNNIVLALAGYNAGEGAVVKYGYQVPPYAETINYVQRITARYRSIATT